MNDSQSLNIRIYFIGIWCQKICQLTTSITSSERELSCQRPVPSTFSSTEDIYSREVRQHSYKLNSDINLQFILFIDTLMSDVYNQRKDADGFLYITYTNETTLGWKAILTNVTLHWKMVLRIYRGVMKWINFGMNTFFRTNLSHLIYQ